MSVLPIKPSEVVEKKEELPDGVIEVYNDLIAKNFKDGRAVVLHKHALSAIAIKMHTSKEKCINNRWLDVMEVFQEAGWDVKHRAPPYAADGEEQYIFIKKGS